jgi:hypothetical protein
VPALNFSPGGTGDGDVEVGLGRCLLEEAADGDEPEDYGERDERGEGLAGAEAEADANGEEEEGEFFGFLDRGPEANDREGAHEAEGKRERRFDDADDQRGGDGQQEKIPGEYLAVRERLAEAGVDHGPAQDPENAARAEAEAQRRAAN